jgi:ATP-dependent DNA helicase RecQ
VINIVNLLREEKILADAKDLTAFIKKGENINRSLKIVETFSQIENFLLPVIEEKEKTFHMKELNEDAEAKGCKDVTPNKIKTIINFWAIKNWIKRHNEDYSKNHVVILCVQPKESLKEKLEKRHQLARFLVEFLYQKSNLNIAKDEKEKEEVLVEFSVHGTERRV